MVTATEGNQLQSEATAEETQSLTVHTMQPLFRKTKEMKLAGDPRNAHNSTQILRLKLPEIFKKSDEPEPIVKLQSTDVAKLMIECLSETVKNA